MRPLDHAALDAANRTEATAVVEAGHDFDPPFTDVIMPGAIHGKELPPRLQGAGVD